MATVKNQIGQSVDFCEALILMDNEIREHMCNYHNPRLDNIQEFFAEYARRHSIKFNGEGFALWVGVDSN